MASQGADESLRTSLPVTGQCRLDQGPSHPVAARLRRDVQVQPTPHRPTHSTGVEPDGLTASVGDEQDSGRVPETPRDDLVERIGVGGRGFEVAIAGLRQPHLGPQAGHGGEILFLDGSHDDLVGVLAHSA
jgi:hypothetical protein